MSRILFILSLVVAPAFLLQSQTVGQVDGVTVKDQQVYAMNGEQLEILTENLKLPFDVVVNTNGFFKVGPGKERPLQAGQVLRRDGWLLNPDGSLETVFDHVAMKDGKVQVVRDGQTGVLAKPMYFPNGLSVSPDGSCVYPSGANARLVDGQLFHLDGTPIPTKDTISLKNGRVVVQKAGTLIPLSGVQIMGMSDGTRVHADGLVVNHDGTSFKLREGETILVDGVLVRH